MKKLIQLSVLIAVVGLVSNAVAEGYFWHRGLSVTSNIPDSVAASTTTTIGTVIDIRQTDQFAVVLGVTGADASANDDVTVTFLYATDALGANTVTGFDVVATMNGTTEVRVGAVKTDVPYPYLVVQKVANADVDGVLDAMALEVHYKLDKDEKPAN